MKQGRERLVYPLGRRMIYWKTISTAKRQGRKEGRGEERKRIQRGTK